jgi:hypothetical protein
MTHHEALGVDFDSVGLRVHSAQAPQHKVDHVEQLVNGIHQRHRLSGRRLPHYELARSRSVQRRQRIAAGMTVIIGPHIDETP